jgi:cell wall-associated NlpC family hydrolase
MTKSEIVEEAKTWIDTPFHHQGRLKNYINEKGELKKGGVDCAGIIVGVLNHFNIKHKDYTGYTREESSHMMLDSLQSSCEKIEELEPGAIVLFWQRRFENTNHIGIMSGFNTLIHADQRPGINRVTLIRINNKIRSQIHSIYRLPGAVD